MAVKKEQLAAQLKTAANQLGNMEGFDLALAITDVCSALLLIASDEAKSAGKLAEEDLLDLMSGYQGVIKKLDMFVAGLPETDSKYLVSDLETRLAIATTAVQEHEALIESLSGQISSAERRKNELASEIADMEKTLASVEEAMGELEGILGLWTAGNQVEVQDQNLYARVDRIGNRLEAAVQREGEYNQDLAQHKLRLENLQDEAKSVRESIEEVQTKINAIPQYKRDLLEQYRKLSDELAELREAEQNCSEEKQAELRRKIEELAPEVDELKTETETLEKRIQELEVSKTEYDEVKETLTTDVVRVIQTAIAQAAPIISTHKERLEETKRIADVLESNLADCERMRRGLRGWYESQKTPLEAMEDVVKHEAPDDVPKLLETLNPSAIERVQMLSSQAEEALRGLDGILEACVRASGYDTEALLRKVY